MIQLYKYTYIIFEVIFHHRLLPAELFFLDAVLYSCIPSLSLCVFAYMLSHVQVFKTLWTVAHQGPLSMGFSRQEYWSGLPFPPPGDLSNPGIEPRPLALQANALPSESPGKCLI